MARIDDYQQARDLAAQALAQENLNNIIHRSGFRQYNSSTIHVSLLDRIYQVTWPDFQFTDIADPSAQVPLQEQVLTLHYLQGCQPQLTGRWIAYREIPGAAFYFSAFAKRAIEPLKKVFGQNASALRQAAAKLQAISLGTGTAGFQFNVFPFVPLQIILWEGDDEFPAEANILYDSSVGAYLSAEDAAWLASLVVYRLMALAR